MSAAVSSISQLDIDNAAGMGDERIPITVKAVLGGPGRKALRKFLRAESRRGIIWNEQRGLWESDFWITGTVTGNSYAQLLETLRNLGV